MNQPGWKTQYLAPSVIGGAIAFIVSTGFNVWNDIDKSRQETETEVQAFTRILTDTVLKDTQPFDKLGTKYDEQKATVALMALDGLATNEEERRTVLYIGARLLTASSDRADTGGPGARFLDVAIGRIVGDPSGENKRLLAFVRSPGFVDLATAGYETRYYNDNMKITEIQPTLDGDEPITNAAKGALLAYVAPPNEIAWIYLASWRTSLHFGTTSTSSDWDSTNVEALTRNFEKAASTQIDYYVKVADAGGVTVDPSTRLDDWLQFTNQTLVLTRAELARAAAPIVANYIGSESTGTLGRIIGAVPALTCVDLVESPRPVIVFVESDRLRDPKKGWDGLIHLWGHVHVRSACP